MPRYRSGYIAGTGECGERIQGRFSTHGGVGAPVHQLQKLNRELDIAQPTGAELYLTFQLGGRNIIGHAGAHSLHRFHEGIPSG